jgi:hypothetical protein
MRVIVRFRQHDNVLHEWIGNMAGPSDFAQTIHEAIDDFCTLVPDAPLWGLTISIDRYGGGS